MKIHANFAFHAILESSVFQYKNDGLVVFARKTCHGYTVAWGPPPAHHGEAPKKADVDHAGETG